MGCGGSKSVSALANVKIVRDPDDCELDLLVMQKTGIPEFDALFSKVVAPLNTVVKCNNIVNQCISDIQNAAGLLCGAYKVDIRQGKDTDVVLLDFLKADNTRPAVAEVEGLLKKAPVKKADKSLATARDALHKALESLSEPVSLQANEQGVSTTSKAAAATAAIEKFNKAVTEFKGAVGTGYKLDVKVKSSVHPLAATLRFKFVRPIIGGAIGVNPNAAPGAPPTPEEENPEPEEPAEDAVEEEVGAEEDAAGDDGDDGGDDSGPVAEGVEDDDDDDQRNRKQQYDAGGDDDTVDKPGNNWDDDAGAGAPAEQNGDGGNDIEAAKDSGAAANGSSSDASKFSLPTFKSLLNAPPVKVTFVPCTVLEIAKAKTAEQLVKTLPSVLVQCDKLLTDCKGENVKFVVAKKKVKVPAVSPAKKEAAKKTVAAVNIELFKLNKACNNVNGDLNIIKAIFALVKAVEAEVRTKLSQLSPGQALPKLIPMPTFKLNDDFSFDFNMSFPDLSKFGLPSFPDCLPGAALLVWKAIMDTKDRILGLVKLVPQIADKVNALMEEVKQLPDKATSAAQNASLDMMATVKAVKNTGLNCKECVNALDIITAFTGTVKRVADEMQTSVKELQALAN